MIKVTQIWRRPQGGQVSIERLFGWINEELGRMGVGVCVLRLPFSSRGVIRRLANMLWVACRAPSGAHITGDVSFIALALMFRRPILTIHDVGRLHDLVGLRQLVMKKVWFEWPMKVAAQVVFISQETMSDVARWIPLDHSKCRVIHNVADPTLTPVGPPRRRMDVPVCLQVGTKENKNVHTIIPAVAAAGGKLVVIGSAGQDIRDLASAHGCDVSFLGQVSDEELQAIYRDCDIVLFVSLFEGFGLPVIEAQKMLKPVVISDLPVLREVAGDGALVVREPRNALEVAAAIRELASNSRLRSRLVDAGARNASRFEVSHIAREYADLYRRSIGVLR